MAYSIRLWVLWPSLSDLPSGLPFTKYGSLTAQLGLRTYSHLLFNCEGVLQTNDRLHDFRTNESLFHIKRFTECTPDVAFDSIAVSVGRGDNRLVTDSVDYTHRFCRSATDRQSVGQFGHCLDLRTLSQSWNIPGHPFSFQWVLLFTPLHSTPLSDFFTRTSIVISSSPTSLLLFSLVIDTLIYGSVFQDMKLGGVLLILFGFAVVLLPDNWNEYLGDLLRRRLSKWKRKEQMKKNGRVQDTSTGQVSRLRTNSGRVK